VAELYVHPVKSCAAIAVQSCEVDTRGPRHDRRFMIVGGREEFVTQREEPRLALIQTAIEDQALVLTAPRLAPHMAPLRVALEPAGHAVMATVWRDEVAAIDVGDAAARWLADALGAPALRLVFMPDTTLRPVDHAAAHGAVVGFADAFPFLVISTASLAAVEAKAPGTGVARRFRPNVVLDGLASFEEDAIEGVAIGDVVLRFVKPCARCRVIDVDPERGVLGREPLASLAHHRRRGRQVMFGENAVHEGVGTLRVGDVARVLGRKRAGGPEDASGAR